MASELGVNTIQHTNGTDALTIDSSGRILTPKRPAFGVSTSTGINLTTGTFNKITWSTVDWDYGSNWDTANNYFVVPVTGVYRFDACVRVTATNNTMEVIHVALGLNGGTRSRDLLQLQTSANNLYNSHVGGGTDWKLTAGDTVQLNVNPGSPSAPVAAAASRVYNWFTGHLIG